MNKKTVATCLAGTMLWSTVATSAMAINVDQLVDVEKNDWFYPYVQYVTAQDYMEGIGENKFAPAMEMNRAMFVTVLYRLDEPTGVSGDSQFTDVPAGTWYTEAVNWAVKNGIVLGMGDNTFAPTASITREQMCTMMSRFVEYRAKKDNKTFKNQSEEKTFADADRISEYAKEAVKKCQLWGLMEGDEKGNFNPLNNATRAEVAAVIKRLDTLLASGQSQGGSGGPPTPSGNVENYKVTVKVNVPDNVSSSIDPELVASYTVSLDSKTTLSNVVKKLIGDSENQTVLKNSINGSLEKLYGKTFTETINDQTVTVNVDDNGVISASMAMKVTQVTGDGTQTFANVSNEQLEELINKLQNGGNMEFTIADVSVMEALLNKIDEVQNMPNEELQNKIDQVVADKPELEQVISGMTPEAIKEAAGSYHKDLNEIKGQVEEALNSGDSSVIIKSEPVLMNVQMDLSKYLNDAKDEFKNNKDDAINRLQTELGITFTDAQRTNAGALYDLNDPEKYVTPEGKNLVLKNSSDYYTLLQKNVNTSIIFYESLNGKTEFYKELLTQAYVSAKGEPSADVEQQITQMATLLSGESDLFIDVKNGEKVFRDDTKNTFTVNLDQGMFEKLLQKAAGQFDNNGIDSLIPSLSEKLANEFGGEYILTFDIDKK